MIARDDDQSARVEAGRAQPVEDARDLGIGVRDLTVVGALRARRKLRRRTVGSVRIVHVDPHEEWLMAAAFALQPRERRVDDRRCRPFGIEAIARLRIASNAIVVRVEALRQPEAAVEDEGADERRRLIAGALEQTRDRRVIVGQRVDAVFADAMDGRRQAGEDRRVRWQRQRHRAARVREPHARRRETIQRGRDTDAKSIRPERIDGDEQHVRSLRGSARCAAAAGCGEATAERAEHAENESFSALRGLCGCVIQPHFDSVLRSASNRTCAASPTASSGTCSMSPCIDATASAGTTAGKMP